jgi:putative salt-induced outer membrane protein YdiY
VAPLSTSVALRLSYIVKFNNTPDPGFEKTDRLFSAGVQIAF